MNDPRRVPALRDEPLDPALIGDVDSGDYVLVPAFELINDLLRSLELTADSNSHVRPHRAVARLMAVLGEKGALHKIRKPTPPRPRWSEPMVVDGETGEISTARLELGL